VRRQCALVVDDDPVVSKLIAACLRDRGWLVQQTCDGRSAVAWLEDNEPEVVLLDVLLPDVSGDELCRKVRDLCPAPILMVSAVEDPREKVRFLNAGADDYITKPFSPEELIARVSAILRRARDGHPACGQTVECGNVVMIRDEGRVFVSTVEVRLTPTEFRLLEALMCNLDKVLTHHQLLSRVWGPEFGSDRAYLHVFIGRLRAKLEEDPRRPRRIVTVPGVGYRMTARDL